MGVFGERGIAVPRDVSPVTAVRQPVAALGPRAVTLLVETAWQEASGFGQELVPVDLVVRGSVAPPADA
jgi:LacI family transcriptional regulator